MQKQPYDAIIIGAGVIGASIAYHLSKRKGRFLVLEEKGDVCEGTSKANSGIAHGGYDAEPGSWKARMNLEGIRKMETLSKMLDFPYEKTGSLVLCHAEEDRPRLTELYVQGTERGIPGLAIVEREELRRMEPQVQDDVVAALYCPESGIVDPFLMTIALAEQAQVNGVAFRFYQKVVSIHATDDRLWRVQTPTEGYLTRTVINAAGLFSDQIHRMVSEQEYHIRPRKGEYLLLDREAEGLVRHVLFDLPTERGKGVLIAPTCDGNVLLGPTAAFLSDKRALETTQEGLDFVREKASGMLRDIPFHLVITSFTGLRAHEVGGDFILGESRPGFFDCVGIESPGLTSAPAIGEYIAGEVNDSLHLPENADFREERKGIPKTRTMFFEEKEALIRENPAFAQVICRCESVTEGEILAAIHRPLGARSLDGLKRRCRATAGRCQGGFCTPRLIECLAREWGVDWDQITKRDLEALLVTRRTK